MSYRLSCNDIFQKVHHRQTRQLISQPFIPLFVMQWDPLNVVFIMFAVHPDAYAGKICWLIIYPSRAY